MQIDIGCFAALPSHYTAISAAVIITGFLALVTAIWKGIRTSRYVACVNCQRTHAQLTFAEDAGMGAPALSEDQRLLALHAWQFKIIIQKGLLTSLLFCGSAIVVLAVFQADYCFPFKLGTNQRTILLRIAAALTIAVSWPVHWYTEVIRASPVLDRAERFAEITLFGTLMGFPRNLAIGLYGMELVARFTDENTTCLWFCQPWVFHVFSFYLTTLGALPWLRFLGYWVQGGRATSPLSGPFLAAANRPWQCVLSFVSLVLLLAVSVGAWQMEFTGPRIYDLKAVFQRIDGVDVWWHVTSLCFMLYLVSACVFLQRMDELSRQGLGHHDVMAILTHQKEAFDSYTAPDVLELKKASQDSVNRSRELAASKTGDATIV